MVLMSLDRRFFTFTLLVIFSVHAYSQRDPPNVKIKNAYQGYDLVSYHQFDKPLKGSKDFSFEYNTLKFRFISEENLLLFKSDPTKYLPQYGGSCAYGIALGGKHFWGNPKSYEIHNGKLYFFYKRSFLDYKKKWLNKGTDSLRLKADENWRIQTEN
ncbi:MAG: hypothetical protein ACI8YO_002927 [Gammaproteobacteria bacterium]|jgi:hypothetical protein